MSAKGEGESAAADEERGLGFGASSVREAFRFKETLSHLGLRQLESKLRAGGDEVLLQQVEEEKKRRRTGSHDVEQIAKQVASLSYDALLASWDRLYLESGPNQKAAIEVVKAELSSRQAPPDPLRDGSSRFDAVETFDLARVKPVLLGAAEVAAGHRPPSSPEPPREGEPMHLLLAFPALGMREGFVLRAWLWGDMMDGFGEVWAVPSDTELGAPPKQLRDEPPWPVDALDDFMEALEGDGSAWSYLCASLFAREAVELGRAGHTCHWSTHVLLDADPLEALPRRGSASPDAGDDLAWSDLGPARPERPEGGPSGWYEDWERWDDVFPDRQRPTEWAPTVSESEEGVVVRFYTRTSMWRETVWRNTDIYRLGSYRPRMILEELATGPTGPMV